MRKKIVAQRSLFEQAIDLLVSIFKPGKKLKKNGRYHWCQSAHNNGGSCWLDRSCNGYGYHGISAEQLVPFAILKQWKRYSYGELYDRLNDGVCLRWLTRFYSDPIPRFSTLQKAIKSIKDETWSRINEILVRHAREKRLETANRFVLMPQ